MPTPDHPEPGEIARRLIVTAPAIDLRANLNNEDDEGLNWSLRAQRQRPVCDCRGAVVVAGSERFWSWVRIRHVDEDGQVHFEQLTAEEAAKLVPRAS
jgi:hypothetical protein